MVRVELALDTDLVPFVTRVRGCSRKVAGQVVAGIDKYLAIDVRGGTGFLAVYDGPAMGRGVVFVSRADVVRRLPQQFKAVEWAYGQAPKS